MANLGPIKASDALNPVVTRTALTEIGVNRVFAPEGINPAGVARYVDRSGGIALLYPSISMSLRPPTKASRIYKTVAKVVLPTGDVTAPSTATGIQPAPSKAYDHSCIMEWLSPERGTLAERQMLFRIVMSLFFDNINAQDDTPTDVTGSPLRASVENFEAIY
jgi:hypothetical protein